MWFLGRKRNLTQPIEGVWSLEARVSSTPHADCYRAIRRDTRQSVLLWVTVAELNEQQQVDFNEHIKRLQKMRVVAPSAYGVDSNRTGYVELVSASGKRLDYDLPDSATLRARFLEAVYRISEIHSAGYAVGDITAGSFLVRDDSRVEFIGCAGGYEVEDVTTIANEVQHFLLPHLKTFGEPEVASDVYALSVLGLSLFGADLPSSSLSAEQVATVVDSVPTDTPQWVSAVLGEVLRQPERELFKDAGELLRAIQIRERAADTTTPHHSRDGEKRSDGSSGDDNSTTEMSDSFEPLRRQPLPGAVVLLGVLVLVAVVAVLAASGRIQFTFAGVNTNPGDVGAATQSESANAHGALSHSIDAVMAARQFVESEGASVQKGLSETLFAQAEGEGLSHSASFIRGLVSSHAALLGEGGKAAQLAELLNSKLSAQERRALIDRIGSGQQSVSTLAAVAAVFDQPASADTFRDIVLEYVRRAAPSTVTAGVESLSTVSLALAADGQDLFPKVTEEAPGAQLSDAELWWLLSFHSHKRSKKMAPLLRLALSRKLVAWPRLGFIEVMSDSDVGSNPPYEQLIRSAKNGPGLSDVEAVSAWYAPASEKALYLILLASEDPEVAKRAIGGLLSKPLSNPAVMPLIQTIRERDESALVLLGAVMGIVGLADSLQEDIAQVHLRKLRNSSLKQPVCNTLLERGSSRIIRAVLGLFGSDLNPESLLVLLEHPDSEVRKTVIPYLTTLSLASSRERLRRSFEQERDQSVREVYARVLARR
jgi:hypothetical protein